MCSLDRGVSVCLRKRSEYVCVYTHTHAHTHIHTRTTHTHTHTHAGRKELMDNDNQPSSKRPSSVKRDLVVSKET
jgi:hypothetical protein